MGLGEGNQAWAGTSARMSLNIVHADDSFRLLERHCLPYTRMLACLTPRLCCVLPVSSPFRGERRGSRLYVNADTFWNTWEWNKPLSLLYLRAEKYKSFHFNWVISNYQIGTACAHQRLRNYWNVTKICFVNSKRHESLKVKPNRRKNTRLKMPYTKE